MADTIKPGGGWSQIYNSIFDQSIMGIVLCAMDGSILESNPAFCRMLGYSNGELLSRTVEQLTHPDDWARENACFPHPPAHPPAGSHFSAEKRYFHKDGHVVWANVHATTIRGTNNVPVFGFAIIEDITERKLAEQSLKESESRYRSLFAEMINGFALHEVIVDRDGNPCDYRYLDVNPAFERLTGLPRSKVIGSTVRELIPDIEPMWITSFGNVALTGIPTTFTDCVKALDKHFSVHAYSPAPRQFAVVFTDVTELALAEKKLSAEKERLSVTLRSIGDGVVATDTDGNITLANRVIERWLDSPTPNLVGRPVSQALPLKESSSQHPCAQAIETAVREKQRYEPASPLNLLTSQQQTLWVSVTGSPIYDLTSTPIGMVFVLRNVTEQMLIQEERIKTEKIDSLGHLAAGIAHDFNNLLTAILGNISLAKTSQDTPVGIGDLLTDAETAVNQARHLTQQLLTFARGGSPVKEPTDIGRLVRETADFSLRGSNSRLEFRSPSSLWAVEADPHQIAQAIRSLVINADQAMPGGGPIHVTADNFILDNTHPIPLPPGQYVRISVTDSGVGIAERYLPKIFDPYFTTKQQGSGMGLATTLSIVKSHGGHITVASRPGIGTTFDVYLPAIVSSASAPSPEPRTPTHGNNTIRVLVMDDEEAIRCLSERILTHNGCSVTTTANGEEAIAAYEAARASCTPFDIVILDLTIRGGMGGKDTMLRLREIDPAVKAIVSSGYSNDPVMSNYRKYGFRGIVPKPYQAEALIRAVAELARPAPSS